MNEIEYLLWLVGDTATHHPELAWFMARVSESLNQLTIEDVQYYYVNELTDWEVLKLCAYQSIDLNIEHTTVFIDAVFRQLATEPALLTH